MATVETVRGPVDVSTLGPTLMHEHIVNVNAELARDQPSLSWGSDPAAIKDSIVTALDDVTGRGIRTIVDATAFGHGRDVGFVKEVAGRPDLNLIVATGIYTYDELPFYFQYRPADPGTGGDVLTEFFVKDIRDGIGETEVKAGIIKCATDLAGVTPSIDRVLRAVAAAHRETGVPITTHTTASERNGLDQQRIFLEEGVDLTRVIIGHSGDSDDPAYLRELMDAGSYIGADRFGMYMPGFPDLDQRASIVAQLCHEGYADKIVLSHDHTLFTDWFAPGTFPLPPEWRQTHISDAVIPALRERGVTERQVEAMLVDNPRRIFEVQGGY